MVDAETLLTQNLTPIDMKNEKGIRINPDSNPFNAHYVLAETYPEYAGWADQIEASIEASTILNGSEGVRSY